MCKVRHSSLAAVRYCRARDVERSVFMFVSYSGCLCAFAALHCLVVSIGGLHGRGAAVRMPKRAPQATRPLDHLFHAPRTGRTVAQVVSRHAEQRVAFCIAQVKDPPCSSHCQTRPSWPWAARYMLPSSLATSIVCAARRRADLGALPFRPVLTRDASVHEPSPRWLLGVRDCERPATGHLGCLRSKALILARAIVRSRTCARLYRGPA